MEIMGVTEMLKMEDGEGVDRECELAQKAPRAAPGQLNLTIMSNRMVQFRDCGAWRRLLPGSELYLSCQSATVVDLERQDHDSEI
jgi:hypothetical protein